MALIHSRSLSNGVEGNYWRVDSFKIRRKDGTASVGMALYTSLSAREAGKEPIALQFFEVPGFGSASLDSTNPVTLCYLQIKSLPDFAGAEDA